MRLNIYSHSVLSNKYNADVMFCFVLEYNSDTRKCDKKLTM